MRKIMGVFLMVFLLTGCTMATFDGSRTGDDNQFLIIYNRLNGTESQLLHLEEGDQVAIKIVADAGEVEVEVRKDNNEPIYRGTLTSDLSFILGIDKSGSYKCTVTGRKARGSVSFIKQEREKDKKVYDSETMMGYIWIEDNVVYVDEVEVITADQQERIKTLELVVANDLPNGYYIYNEINEAIPFEITEDTVYSFSDIELKFSQDNISRHYETSKVEEFRTASSYQDKPLEEQKIPYRIEVYQDKVISITEELLFTQ